MEEKTEITLALPVSASNVEHDVEFGPVDGELLGGGVFSYSGPG